MEREWLDELPAETMVARLARRDLGRLNAWMGHAGILATSLRRLWPAAGPHQLVELGAGDGELMAQVACRLPHQWAGSTLTLVDRQWAGSRKAEAALAQAGWRVERVRADVHSWLRGAGHSQGIVANLFLHHFTEPALKQLLALAAAHTDAFVALEPRRCRRGLFCSYLVGGIGCSRVTRHDAPVSVRAGFSGRELSELWAASTGWRLLERPAGWCSQLFSAQRCPPA